ncbi:glutathione S-transferase [Rhizophagus irregularis]|nr:glutathione S-transferase [Rhizophagus irregularis]PKC75231.1 glutathione S-transferase [Rhizophagus irregularis]PKY28415.1 glutathione S-transferase [Rhizophagus irregularis]
MSVDIQAYLWPTPNGKKIYVVLEELNIPYDVRLINIGKNEQFAPEFLKISPNNKIPAIVDQNPPKEFGDSPISIFESAAILQYLADYKKGEGAPDLYPKNPRERVKVNEWLYWQIAGLGPMMGQSNHFSSTNIDYAKERYSKEVDRLLGVMNKRLGEYNYLAGDNYTIADIASYTWLLYSDKVKAEDTPYPNIKAWFERISERPAVKRAAEKANL